ncbi:hypothetical protein [Streptomyces sp. NPDC090080]|uniref:hypothetical protein n=1 Tax=Streptomyces sp. NPDC090080 TaxID=3365939 RepID=UPI00380F17B0
MRRPLRRLRGRWSTAPRLARLSLISIPCAALLATEPERWLATAVALLSLAYTAYAVLAPQAVPPPGAAALDEILAHERKDTLNLIWVQEAVRRGLDAGVLLPLPLSAPSGPAGRDHRVVLDPLDGPAPTGLPRAAAGQYGADLGSYYASLVRPDGPLFRAVVSGGPGAGKTTLALLITRSALQGPTGPVPLLLRLASWDARHESFERWLEDAAVGQLRSLARSAEWGHGRLGRRLLASPDVWLILDGADEIPREAWEDAVSQLREISAERQLLVLARPAFASLLAEGLAARRLGRFDLLPPEPARVRRYLTQLATDSGTLARWEPLIRELRQGSDAVAGLLTVPLYLDMAWRLYGGRDAPPGTALPATPGALAALAREAPDRTRTALMDGFIAVAFHRRRTRSGADPRTPSLPGARRAAYHAAWLADRTGHGRTATPGVLTWWGITAWTPHGVLVGACAPVLVLGYLLGLHMPVGFTRGLTIGFTTVLTMGMLRDSEPRPSGWPRAEVLTGIAGAAGVAAVGTALIDLRGGVIDALELGCAFTAVLLLLPRLTGASRGRAIGALFAVPVAGTLVVAALLLSGWQLPKGGGWFQAYGSMLIGTGLGTLTCRWLSEPAAAPEASRVALTNRPRLQQLWLCLVRGIVPAVGIGSLAGLFLTLQFGWSYGTALIVVFGLCLGVPTGILAGLLLWYNQHRPDGDSATARGSLTNDRRVLAGCVLGATLLETAGAATVVHGFGDRLLTHDGRTVLVLHVHHGVLFGLAIGWILASCYTASIPVTVGHAWHALHGRLPWRIGTYLDALHSRDVLIQFGRTYQFRHANLGTRLAERLPELGDSTPPTG